VVADVVELTVRTRPVTVVERWFDAPTHATRADIVMCHQVPTPIDGAISEPFDTRLIDLRAGVDSVLAGMDKSTRYKIRRSERDGVAVEFLALPSDDELSTFADDYDQFATIKQRDRLDRARLRSAVRAGLVEVSRAVDQADGRAIVWHAHVVTPKRARLLHSVSLFRGDSGDRRNLIGRANRFLHWQTIIRHAEADRPAYDLGGWYTGTEDEQRLRINEFKQGFGGEVVREYDCRLIQTLKGRVWELASRLRR
jgi:hypothetical protein